MALEKPLENLYSGCARVKIFFYSRQRFAQNATFDRFFIVYI